MKFQHCMSGHCYIPSPSFLPFQESHHVVKAGLELAMSPRPGSPFHFTKAFLDPLIYKTSLFLFGEAVIDSSTLTLYLCIWACQTFFYFGSLRGYGRVNSYRVVS